jgi:hypothetical protein
VKQLCGACVALRGSMCSYGVYHLLPAVSFMINIWLQSIATAWCCRSCVPTSRVRDWLYWGDRPSLITAEPGQMAPSKRRTDYKYSVAIILQGHRWAKELQKDSRLSSIRGQIGCPTLILLICGLPEMYQVRVLLIARRPHRRVREAGPA